MTTGRNELQWCSLVHPKGMGLVLNVLLWLTSWSRWNILSKMLPSLDNILLLDCQRVQLISQISLSPLASVTLSLLPQQHGAQHWLLQTSRTSSAKFGRWWSSVTSEILLLTILFDTQRCECTSRQVVYNQGHKYKEILHLCVKSFNIEFCHFLVIHFITPNLCPLWALASVMLWLSLQSCF